MGVRANPSHGGLNVQIRASDLAIWMKGTQYVTLQNLRIEFAQMMVVVMFFNGFVVGGG